MKGGGGASALAAGNLYCAANVFNQRLHQIQTQARTTVEASRRGSGLCQLIEQVVHAFLWNARACVVHRELQQVG